MDVFHSVNLAWKHSFYNETAACLMRPSPEASGAEGNNLTANWVCPPCSARTRVVSITGGKVAHSTVLGIMLTGIAFRRC